MTDFLLVLFFLNSQFCLYSFIEIHDVNDVSILMSSCLVRVLSRIELVDIIVYILQIQTIKLFRFAIYYKSLYISILYVWGKVVYIQIYIKSCEVKRYKHSSS